MNSSEDHSRKACQAENKLISTTKSPKLPWMLHLHLSTPGIRFRVMARPSFPPQPGPAATRHQQSLAEGERERRTRSGVAVDEETGGRSSGRRLSARMEHRRDFGLATRTGGRTCWRYPGKAAGRAVGGGCRRAEQRDEMRPGETEGYGGGWTKMRAYWSFHVTHCPLTDGVDGKIGSRT